MISGTASGVLFALGMCMALIPEWGAFKPGLPLGSAWSGAGFDYSAYMEKNGA